jgi:hypothetical protein
MAITIQQQTEILEVVTGLFNAAPGNIYMTELANLVEDGMSIEQLASFLTTTPIFKNGILGDKVTVQDQANILMKNFGLTADNNLLSAGTQAKAYFEQKLIDGQGLGKIVIDALNYLHDSPAPEFAETTALLINKVQVAKLYSLNHASADLAKLQSVLVTVSATAPATEADALAYLQGLDNIEKPGPANFILTFGTDTLTGNASNDTFTAMQVNNGIGTLVNSLEDIDSLNGGAGIDTLNASLDGSAIATALRPEINNVEIINIRNVTSDVTIDFAMTTNAKQIWNNTSQANRVLTFENAPIAAIYGIKNTHSKTVINSFIDDVTSAEDNRHFQLSMPVLLAAMPILR